jgi:hypothetical protein
MTGNGTRRGAFRQGREMTGRGESRSGLFALQTGLRESYCRRGTPPGQAARDSGGSFRQAV